MRRIAVSALAWILVAAPLFAQQEPDTTYAPPVVEPEFPAGEAPVVLFDEAHNQFHTLSDSYRAFASLLERDGYVVGPNAEPFSTAMLEAVDVLVISNALAEENVEDWYLPTPSAFTEEEIAAVERWVREGGALLLIADHMPFPGAAEAMAAAFGVRFQNGFAADRNMNGTITFRRSDGSLAAHPVTDGRGPAERVDSLTTFMGQAFRATADVAPLLVVPEGYELALPEIAWQFSRRTPRIPAVGLHQGVVLEHGQGRVAAFGEAAAFTAQVVGPERRPMGMNHPAAGQNHRFVLNVLHWLTGRLD